jgi:hypothetical protein
MATDCHGRPVAAGSKVRVLEVAQFLKARLAAEEWQELLTMVGEVFEVYEIDEHGQAWVEKTWFNENGGYDHGHSLGLDSHEMQLVSPSRR